QPALFTSISVPPSSFSIQSNTSRFHVTSHFLRKLFFGSESRF
uniref:Uncharacterized protein n=1 Tax=Megaselia scalaris TaxID=36166 RepID=T1H6Y5_MEGSC